MLSCDNNMREVFMSFLGKMFGGGQSEPRNEERSFPLDQGLAAFFQQDHRNCDLDYAELEAALGTGNEEEIKEKWQCFDKNMRRHFEMEEKEFFPQFEQKTGMTQGGPTFVMRMEHARMCVVLEQMAALIEEGQYEEVRNQGDTLLMLAQQHNVKEEGMLYPMAGQHLAQEWSEISESLKGYLD
ncbi:MAG: hypothetical protein CSA81_01545 [Acidobacteria bacterium]|nr:MAG: hypothetical protein CSA81_01545 [Acidobacteriota bacterium]